MDSDHQNVKNNPALLFCHDLLETTEKHACPLALASGISFVGRIVASYWAISRLGF